MLERVSCRVVVFRKRAAISGLVAARKGRCVTDRGPTKRSWLSIILVAWVLLITLGLLSCGSGSHSVTSGSGSYPRTFAYLKGSYSGVPGPPIPNLTVDIGSGPVDLYVMDTSTGISTKVNPQSAAFENVQLSADGSKLLFTASDSEACTEIYMADAKFQTLTQLTQYFVGSPCFDHREAALSSDGTMITFVYGTPNNSISTIPPVGGAITQILVPGVPGSVVDVAIDPVFTPDGKSVVFRGYPLGSGTSYIYIVNLDGTGLAQLSSGPGNGGSDTFPAVSPDGTQVAFTRVTLTQTYVSENIAVIGIGGESAANPAKMLTTDGKSWQPMWLGGKILFLSWKDNLATCVDGVYQCHDNIYEMNADGSNVVRLTNTTLETAFDPAIY
jgi:WD40-like Beta Propeller Repeat